MARASDNMFDFLFNRAKKDNISMDDVQATDGPGTAVGNTAPVAPPEPLCRPWARLGALSDLGRQREINEDALATLIVEFEQDNHRQSVGAFIVADGMGGHDRGEIASQTAARTVLGEMMQRLIGPLMRGQSAGGPLGDEMQGAVLAAHDRIRNELPGSGTTLTAALVMGDMLGIAHVGDSRAYICRGGVVSQITHDHSFVAKLVEMGQATPEEAAVDPRRNFLLRAVGQADDLDVDFEFEEFPAGSRLLICSDGLWGHVEPADLERILRECADPQAACQDLIDRANAGGGPDNITAVVVIRT